MSADRWAVRAWLGCHLRVADAALALLVLAVSLQPLVEQAGCGCAAAPAWGYALVFAQCLPLVWRRRWPFATGLVVGMVTAVIGLTSLAEPVVPFAGLVGLYTAAAHSSRRLSLVAGGVAAVAITVTLLLAAADADAQDYTVNYLVFATAWLLGDSARSRRDRAAELEARLEQTERTRAAQSQRVVAEERTRIARELHDVVAHAMSVMVVQAEAGPVVVDRDPARAVAAFDQISATGKQALAEMRRLLGVLRTDPQDRLAPQPGLSGLPALVAGCIRAGLPVGVVVEGELRPLAPAVNLSAYRIVQEALTNTLRHAGPARAQVRVRYDDDAVRLRISDDGVGASDGSTMSAGNGIVGMRERASLLGGTLRTGPGKDGGWTVEADLPAPTPVSP